MGFRCYQDERGAEVKEFDTLAELCDELGHDMPSLKGKVIAQLRLPVIDDENYRGMNPPRKLQDADDNPTIISTIGDYFAERYPCRGFDDEHFTKTLRRVNKHPLLVVYNGIKAAPEMPGELFCLLSDWQKVYFMAGVKGIHMRNLSAEEPAWNTVDPLLEKMTLGEIAGIYIREGVDAMIQRHKAPLSKRPYVTEADPAYMAALREDFPFTLENIPARLAARKRARESPTLF